ncbi:MAG: hypothetical protein NT165_01555 [Candidatus Falkowbacteria bacterium]|nr:hypothetical protein [Candidatus Falkowbacteria bacterium]
MLTSEPSVPHLIAEKVRLKSRIASRNYLLGEFRQIVKRENERDSKRIADIEKILAERKKAPSIRKYKSFLFF